MIAPMVKYLQKQSAKIHQFLSKFPGFANPEKYSLNFLNSAQFCGALNDNIYKFVLIFYLIQLKGPDHANTILSIAGAVFVIPFLLFSSAAGILADRLSKNRMIIFIKVTEILIILLAIAAFAFKIMWGSYALLFLLATQSAVFSPPKYGIIPELVSKNKVSKANGLITSFTYLAIIFGTFLASFLTELTNRNYVLVGCFCLLISFVGFFSSFGIKHTESMGSQKKVDIFFVREILRTLSECKDQKHLLACIYGGAYFLFVGGFTQLNIIPFAISSLGLTEVAGGYLFLTTALGIASGAWSAGKVSRKHHIELGLTCFAGLFIAIFFFVLAASSFNIVLAVIALFFIGFSGGNFIVPFESFIQLFSPEQNRSHVIAAANFLSFIGVLIASFALFLFNEVFNFTAAQSFIVMGVLTIIFTLVLFVRLSDHVLSFSARNILRTFISVKVNDLSLVRRTKNPLLMLEDATLFKAWLLTSALPNVHLLFPQYKTRSFPWFQRVFFSLHRIESPQKFETLVSKSRRFRDPNMIPCIYLNKKKPVPEKQMFSIRTIFTRKSYEVISVNIERAQSNWHIRFSK
ncbi:MAG: Lysophospholipid transporter LplT [Chlamydiae bacterium]|nr:Lysophospholipid transporter LplT [Chlamydiota bacterium]